MRLVAFSNFIHSLPHVFPLLSFPGGGGICLFCLLPPQQTPAIVAAKTTAIWICKAAAGYGTLRIRV
jgi:hypothetical protein